MASLTQLPAPTAYSGINLAAHPRTAFEIDESADDHLGPWANALACGSLLAGLLLAFGVATVHWTAGIVVLAMAIGAVALAPRSRVDRIPVSLTYFAIFAWILLTVTWTDSPETALFLVKRDVPMWIALPLAASLLDRTQVQQVILWAVRAIVVITTAYLIAKPETRFGIPVPGDPVLPGWHGGFLHKNAMGPVLDIGLAAVLLFDTRPSTKFLTSAAIMTLIVGSQSTTALVGAGFVALIIPWFTVVRKLNGRHIVSLIVSTILLTAAAITATVLSLQTVVQVAGKDLTFTGRTKIWSATWSVIQDRPLVGHGLGGVFSSPPTQVTLQVIRAIGFSVPHAHNGLIDMVSQVGAVGALLFFVMFGATMVNAVRLRHVAPRFATFTVAALATVLIISLSESVFLGSWFGFYGLLLITTIGIRNDERRREAALGSTRP